VIGVADTRRGGLSLRLLVVPALVLAALLVALHALQPRYAIILLPGLALMAGMGFGRLQRRWPRAALVLAALLFGSLGLLRVGNALGSIRHSWPIVGNTISEYADPAGDSVLVAPPWDVRVLEYYYHGPALPMLGAHHYDDFYAHGGHSFEWSWTNAEAVAVTRGYRRVWYVGNLQSVNAQRMQLPYPMLGHWRDGYLELILYEVPGQRE
jgi:hypothetical protein